MGFITKANNNNTELSNVSKYINYIRWAVFELACSGKIDHRNYSTTNAKSTLANYVEQYASADKAIYQIASELCENQEFKEKLAEYYELLGESKETKNPGKNTCDDEDDSCCDKTDDNSELDSCCDDYDRFLDIKQNLFHGFVAFVGLHEIENLNSDDCDRFSENFFQLLKS
jgi:hypothetical protein